MVDVNGIHTQPLRELLTGSQMPSAQIEEFLEEVRSLFPDSPSGEIEYHSTLPRNSIVQGQIDRFSISFTKRYDGHLKIEYRAS